MIKPDGTGLSPIRCAELLKTLEETKKRGYQLMSAADIEADYIKKLSETQEYE